MALGFIKKVFSFGRISRSRRSKPGFDGGGNGRHRSEAEPHSREEICRFRLSIPSPPSRWKPLVVQRMMPSTMMSPCFLRLRICRASWGLFRCLCWEAEADAVDAPPALPGIPPTDGGIDTPRCPLILLLTPHLWRGLLIQHWMMALTFRRWISSRRCHICPPP